MTEQPDAPDEVEAPDEREAPSEPEAPDEPIRRERGRERAHGRLGSETLLSEYLAWVARRPVVWLAGTGIDAVLMVPWAAALRLLAVLVLLLAPWLWHSLSRQGGRLHVRHRARHPGRVALAVAAVVTTAIVVRAALAVLDAVTRL